MSWESDINSWLLTQKINGAYICAHCNDAVRDKDEQEVMPDGRHFHRICWDIAVASLAEELGVAARDAGYTMHVGINGREYWTAPGHKTKPL